jgi:hypothetical protein
MCQQTPSNHSATASSTTIMTKPLSESLPSKDRLDEIADVIAVMKRLEATTYRRPAPSKDPWRPIMMSWMCSMVDIFHLVPQVLSTALWYLDHASPLVHNPSDYQLAGLTALQLAIKVHETRIFPLEQLVRIGNTGITPNDVTEMERKLLKTIQWKLHPPTVECFVYTYSELLQESSRKVLLATTFRYIRQALLQEHEFENSTLAYASMLVAMEEVPIPLQDKQSFATTMLQVAELSAYTPGLSDAFQWLSPRKQREARCETPPPKMQEIISCADDGDGVEVTWCSRGHHEQGAEGSLSPRNVAL